MFYEDLGEFEKSYQLSLVAAYLSPQDADEWLRLAEVK
jgi:general transcription factor 3C polypeptide 3 (transcription factor C subunit 4)